MFYIYYIHTVCIPTTIGRIAVVKYCPKWRPHCDEISAMCSLFSLQLMYSRNALDILLPALLFHFVTNSAEKGHRHFETEIYIYMYVHKSSVYISIYNCNSRAWPMCRSCFDTTIGLWRQTYCLSHLLSLPRYCCYFQLSGNGWDLCSSVQDAQMLSLPALSFSYELLLFIIIVFYCTRSTRTDPVVALNIKHWFDFRKHEDYSG